jgi:IS5 family transposase
MRINPIKSCNKKPMKPKKIDIAQGELFKNRLSNQLNPRDPLLILAAQINWSIFEEAFGAQYTDGAGQPPKPIRLMVGLMMLQHMHGVSDEQVAHQWIQNPYWQYFCGYDYLQWELPCDPSSLTRWRNRLGEEGLEKILAETIVTAVHTKTVAPKDLKKVIADTTVMEKNIAFPTDTKLLNRAREQLVKLACEAGLKLRQTYSRKGKHAALNAGKYAHAKQFKRMRKEVKKLKNYLGRVVRDVERKIVGSCDLQAHFSNLLSMSDRLLTQERKSSNKLYSLHAPETYCIAKGKAGKPYEFGCKVALVITHKQGLALSSMALSENQFDGHTLGSSLKKAEELAHTTIEQSFVDKGYKGHGVAGTQVYISGQKRGMTRTLEKHLKRRSAIEPHIGHMKSEGKLRRNYLKGIIGDALNALLCAIGHNMRMILRTIRSLFVLIWTFILSSIKTEENVAAVTACV